MKPTVVDDRIVSVSAPGSYEAEQYRLLRHIVEDLRKETGARMLALTSPAVGDGKTTTAINLAGALARGRDARVLLVDLDLRRGTVGRQLRPRAAGRARDQHGPAHDRRHPGSFERRQQQGHGLSLGAGDPTSCRRSSRTRSWCSSRRRCATTSCRRG